MLIEVVAGNMRDALVDALVLFVAEDDAEEQPRNATHELDVAMGGVIRNLMLSGDFSGTMGEIAVLYPQDKVTAPRIILVGVGRLVEITIDVVRRVVALGMQKARGLKLQRVAMPSLGTGRGGLTLGAAAHAMAEGALLGLYSYHGQKTSERPTEFPEKVLIYGYSDEDLAGLRSGAATGTAYARGAMLARDLVNLPPNICTPAFLAQRAQEIADRHQLKIQILERQQMKALKMGALLAVAQGSETPPRFIVLEYEPSNVPQPDTLVLIGKGVTFDTGGYSMKSVDGMVGMKGDMGGAAAVLGAMQIIAETRPSVRVVGLIPSADNMVSGKAYRPQEVITASNGKTIEVISTDAEGRLLLADALVYAKRYQPAAVVDIATLTGAMSIALGGAAAGVYSTDDRLTLSLSKAAEFTRERVWPMPLYDEYFKPIESDTADMKNSAGAAGRNGGAGIAALFLKQFANFSAWAHIDMAGVNQNSGDLPYAPGKGGSGFGARLLADWVRLWSNPNNSQEAARAE